MTTHSDPQQPRNPIDRLSRALAPLRKRLGPLAWGTAIVFIIQRSADVANLGCKVFLGRVLTLPDFGAVEPIFATVAILSLPAGIIFGTAVKSISRLRSQGKDAQCRALIHDLKRVALIGSVVTIAAALLLQDFILTRLHLDSPFFIWMMLLMFIATWWGALAAAIIRAEHRYRLLSINSVVNPFLLVGITILLTGLLNLGLEGAIAARAVASLLMLGILLYLLRSSSRGDREPYPDERRIMLNMLLPMSIFAISSACAGNFDRLFVRNFMVDESAGLSAIFTLGQIPRLMLAPLGFVILPIAAAQHASGRQLGRLLLRAAAVASLIIAACCIGFYLFATPVLHLWRPAFAPYGHYVWIYALMVGLQALSAIIAQVELARHRYTFLWFMAPPIPMACAAIYIARDHYHVPITLDSLLWSLTAAHALALSATTIFLLSYATASPTPGSPEKI